ncbi:TRAP transporter small permease [Thermodesulfobacteriota bacterium]
MRLIERLSDSINHWVEYSLFVLGFTMALIVAIQVFSRYVLNESLFWSEELARFLLVWLTFLGATVAYRRKVHPGIDVLYARMPPGVKKAFTLLIHFISIALFTVMIYYGYQFAYFVRSQISPALQLPKWVVFSIIPVSGLIFMIHLSALILREFHRGRHDN